MADTIWLQIVVLFDGFFRYSVLFLVYTVFTSIMYFFCNFLSNPPQKASGFLPPALRAGFLRGVISPIVHKNSPFISFHSESVSLVFDLQIILT